MQRLIACQPFAQAELDTGLIARNQAELFPPTQPISQPILALATAHILHNDNHWRTKTTTEQHDPWIQRTGWRLNHSLERTITLNYDEPASQTASTIAIGINYLRPLHHANSDQLHASANPSQWELKHNTQTYQLRLISATVQTNTRAIKYVIQLDDQTSEGTVITQHNQLHIFHQGHHATLTLSKPLEQIGITEQATGRLTAPMPGKIIALLVKQGQKVQQGDALLVMEAMKMEHTIAAPNAGIIEEILVQVGDQVSDGAQFMHVQ